MAKRNFIRLAQVDEKGNVVSDVNGDVKYETFVTSNSIPLRVIYDSVDFLEGADENISPREGMDTMLDIVVKIYKGQFTKNDLLDRLHAPDATEELQQQILFAAQGEMDEERKKQLAEMI